MRVVLSITLVIALAAVGACATQASRGFTVQVDRHSIQYTPQQIRRFLRDRGYQRVRFRTHFGSGSGSSNNLVSEKRSAEVDEQRFRLSTAREIQVAVRLEKIRRTFGDSEPRVVVRFSEDGRSSLSAQAQREYDELLAQVIERVGEQRVRRH